MDRRLFFLVFVFFLALSGLRQDVCGCLSMFKQWKVPWNSFHSQSLLLLSHMHGRL